MGLASLIIHIKWQLWSAWICDRCRNAVSLKSYFCICLFLVNMVDNMLALENHIGASLVLCIGYWHTAVLYTRFVFLMNVDVLSSITNGYAWMDVSVHLLQKMCFLHLVAHWTFMSLETSVHWDTFTTMAPIRLPQKIYNIVLKQTQVNTSWKYVHPIFAQFVMLL